MSPPPTLLRINDVAADLGISRASVYNLVARRELSIVKLRITGRKAARIKRDNLEAYKLRMELSAGDDALAPVAPPPSSRPKGAPASATHVMTVS